MNSFTEKKTTESEENEKSQLKLLTGREYDEACRRNGSKVLCIFMDDFETRVSKGISGNKLEFFFQFESNTKEKEALDKMVPESLQQMIYSLQNVSSHVSLPLTLKRLQNALKRYRVTEEEINTIWGLCQKYLQDPLHF